MKLRLTKLNIGPFFHSTDHVRLSFPWFQLAVLKHLEVQSCLCFFLYKPWRSIEYFEPQFAYCVSYKGE